MFYDVCCTDNHKCKMAFVSRGPVRQGSSCVPKTFRPTVPSWSCGRKRLAIARAATAQQEAVSGAPDIVRPKTFKRLVAPTQATCFRDAAQLQEQPMDSLQPGAGEVLVQIHWAGINGGCETFRVRQEYAFARGATSTAPVPLGAEGAGVVVATGPGVTKLKVGQAVAVNGASAFAEYAVAKERMVTPVPQLGPEAVVLSLSGVTAVAALEGTAGIKARDVVVVTAAAGGTGHIAVQVAAAAGCKVVAVCGGQRKVEAVRALLESFGGAAAGHLVVDYKAQDLGQALAAAHPQGVDVVYEGVGGAVQATLLKHLAPGGRLLQVGYISEYPHAQGYPTPGTANQPQSPQGPACAPNPATSSGSGSSSNSSSDGPSQGTGAGNQQQQPEVPPCSQLFWGGLEVELPEGRRVIGKVWPKDVAVLARCKKRVYDMHYKQGTLKVLVDQGRSFTGLDSIPDAVEYMLQGDKHVGKVVVRIPH